MRREKKKPRRSELTPSAELLRTYVRDGLLYVDEAPAGNVKEKSSGDKDSDASIKDVESK